MQDETKSGTESRKQASSVTNHATDESVKRGNNTLTLTPGDLLTGMNKHHQTKPIREENNQSD